MFDSPEQAMDLTPVVLVDRACLGGFEFRFNGRCFVFKPKQIELPVPRVVAEWVFRTGHLQVHTRGHGFVHRVALKDAPPDLIAFVGPDCADMEPIELDPTAIEGWDVATMTPTRGKTEIRRLGMDADTRRALREPLPGAATPQFTGGA